MLPDKKQNPTELKLLNTQDDDTPKSKKDPNAARPPGAVPIPPNIVAKYSDRIGDVWWNAKGRSGASGDPTIGIEIDGLRKTFGGYVWNDWWYFQKVVHRTEDEEEPNQCYWYRKKKVKVSDSTDEYETLEEYVGSDLKDLDTGLEIPVPRELRHDPMDLCPSD